MTEPTFSDYSDTELLVIVKNVIVDSEWPSIAFVGKEGKVYHCKYAKQSPKPYNHPYPYQHTYLCISDYKSYKEVWNGQIKEKLLVTVGDRVTDKTSVYVTNSAELSMSSRVLLLAFCEAFYKAEPSRFTEALASFNPTTKATALLEKRKKTKKQAHSLRCKIFSYRQQKRIARTILRSAIHRSIQHIQPIRDGSIKIKFTYDIKPETVSSHCYLVALACSTSLSAVKPFFDKTGKALFDSLSSVNNYPVQAIMQRLLKSKSSDCRRFATLYADSSVIAPSLLDEDSYVRGAAQLRRKATISNKQVAV